MNITTTVMPINMIEVPTTPTVTSKNQNTLNGVLSTLSKTFKVAVYSITPHCVSDVMDLTYAYYTILRGHTVCGPGY